MNTEQMGKARSIVANPWNYLPSLRPWAEALLAEHDARVAAERKRDAMHAEVGRYIHAHLTAVECLPDHWRALFNAKYLAALGEV